MDWFNVYGLIIMILVMVPNILFAILQKGKEAQRPSKVDEVFEQIGRYGCFVLMVFNIPGTYFGFYFDQGPLAYLLVNGILLFAYLVLWGICWNRFLLFRAYALSILPACIFLFSGILLANIPLLAFALVFSVFHIKISVSQANKEPS